MQAVPFFRSHGQNRTKIIEGVSEPWGLADALCRLSIGDGAHRRDVAIGTFRTWRDVRLESVMRTKANMPTTDQGDSNSRNRASSTMCSADKTAQAALEPGSRILGVGGVPKSGRSAAQHFGAISKQEVGT